MGDRGNQAQRATVSAGRLFGGGLAASGAFHRELWRPREKARVKHDTSPQNGCCRK